MSYRPNNDTAKRKEVRQLLEDWAPWHFAGGGASSFDSGGPGAYGPGAMTEAGHLFEKKHRPRYRRYFDALDKALTILRHQDYDAFAVIDRCYLRDPADSGLPRLMEERARPAYRHEKNSRAPRPTRSAENARDFCDVLARGIDALAGYLVNVDTSGVVYGRAGDDRHAENIEARYTEFYELQCRLIAEGRKRGDAIETAARMTGIARSRGYAIMDVCERPVSTDLID